MSCTVSCLPCFSFTFPLFYLSAIFLFLQGTALCLFLIYSHWVKESSQNTKHVSHLGWRGNLSNPCIKIHVLHFTYTAIFCMILSPGMNYQHYCHNYSSNSPYLKAILVLEGILYLLSPCSLSPNLRIQIKNVCFKSYASILHSHIFTLLFEMWCVYYRICYCPLVEYHSEYQVN